MIDLFEPQKYYTQFLKDCEAAAKSAEYELTNAAEMYAVYENICATLFEVIEWMEENRDKLLDEALENPSESSLVRLIQQTKTKRTVDLPKLQAERPDLFEELSFIEARAVQKITGKRYQRDDIRELTGQNPHPSETVNLTDLKKRLNEKEFPEYVIYSEEPAGYTAEENI